MSLNPAPLTLEPVLLLSMTVNVVVPLIAIGFVPKFFNIWVTMKVTDAVWETIMPSVVSVAVYVIGPSATKSFTVNVTMPLMSEVPLAAEMVELPPLFARVTVLPETARFAPSLSVTVIVEVLTPLAKTVVGLAVTVEFAALIASTVSVALAAVPLAALVEVTAPVLFT